MSLVGKIVYKIMGEYGARNRACPPPYHTSFQYENYTQATKDTFATLLTRCMQKEGTDANQCLRAMQSFNEYVWRLDQRYMWVNSIVPVVSSENVNHELQLDLVNRIESYYQQLYATLSAFAMCLSHVSSHEFRRGMSISGLNVFLTHWQDNADNEVRNAVAALKTARAFRAQHVDHVQQHVLHDWVTYSYIKESEQTPRCAVVYFTPSTDRAPRTGFYGIDPHAPNWVPPFSCGDFYVSPSHDAIHDAFFTFTSRLLSQTAQS